MEDMCLGNVFRSYEKTKDKSRLKTIGGPRHNINEGPHTTNFLVCSSIPLGIE